MSDFEPQLEKLKANFRRVLDAYCEFTGKKEREATLEVVGSPQLRIILLDPEADMKAGKYDEWMQRFSNAWPEGLAWPNDVPRPPVEDVQTIA